MANERINPTTQHNEKITNAEKAIIKLAGHSLLIDKVESVQEVIQSLYQDETPKTPDLKLSIKEADDAIAVLTDPEIVKKLDPETVQTTLKDLYVQRDIALNRPPTLAQRLKTSTQTALSYSNPVAYWKELDSEGKKLVASSTALAGSNIVLGSTFYYFGLDPAVYVQGGLLLFNSAMVVKHYRKYRRTNQQRW